MEGFDESETEYRAALVCALENLRDTERNLTSTQLRCNQLLEENRELRAKLKEVGGG